MGSPVTKDQQRFTRGSLVYDRFLGIIENYSMHNIRFFFTFLGLFTYYVSKILPISDPSFFKLRGPGGGPDFEMVKIEFSIVLDRGEPQLPDAFYWIKK